MRRFTNLSVCGSCSRRTCMHRNDSYGGLFLSISKVALFDAANNKQKPTSAPSFQDLLGSSWVNGIQRAPSRTETSTLSCTVQCTMKAQQSYLLELVYRSPSGLSLHSRTALVTSGGLGKALLAKLDCWLHLSFVGVIEIGVTAVGRGKKWDTRTRRT